MSIRIDQFWVVYESSTFTPIDPEYIIFEEEDICQYMEENPMPSDPVYSAEDLISDLTNSSGFLCVPNDTTEATRYYVADLVNELI